MNVLLVEGYDRDAKDILSCLPQEAKVHRVNAINDIGDAALEGKVDLLVVNINNQGDYDKDDHENLGRPFEPFASGVRKACELAEKFNCKTIMTSHAPCYRLAKYFERLLKDDEKLTEYMGGSAEKVSFQMETNTSSSFYLYRSENLKLITKPYRVFGEAELDLEYWCMDLRQLFSVYYEEIKAQRSAETGGIKNMINKEKLSDRYGGAQINHLKN